MNLTRLTKPIKRRIDERLVVTITAEGVAIRGYGCRKSHVVTWAQIAALDDLNADAAITRAVDEACGVRRLAELNALAPPAPPADEQNTEAPPAPLKIHDNSTS